MVVLEFRQKPPALIFRHPVYPALNRIAKHPSRSIQLFLRHSNAHTILLTSPSCCAHRSVLLLPFPFTSPPTPSSPLKLPSVILLLNPPLNPIPASLLIWASSSSAHASVSSGSRTALSIATGNPRCRPRSITAMRINLLPVCHAPQKEYADQGTPVEIPTQP